MAPWRAGDANTAAWSPSSPTEAHGASARRAEIPQRTDGERKSSLNVPVYEAELWTSRQRQASPIHEISYRACFKPQLPAYFIDRLSKPGDVIYDPFSGRGTTAVEAALMGRNVVANDMNPLSAILTRPRLEAPLIANIDVRQRAIKVAAKQRNDIDLSMFYHPERSANCSPCAPTSPSAAPTAPKTTPTAGSAWSPPTGSPVARWPRRRPGTGTRGSPAAAGRAPANSR